MGYPTLKEIKKDEIKRSMWLDGFQHGNVGVPKQLPSYEKESYESGYDYGREGKIDEYIKMVNEDCKKVKKDKSYTRVKREK